MDIKFLFRMINILETDGDDICTTPGIYLAVSHVHFGMFTLVNCVKWLLPQLKTTAAKWAVSYAQQAEVTDSFFSDSSLLVA